MQVVNSYMKAAVDRAGSATERGLGLVLAGLLALAMVLVLAGCGSEGGDKAPPPSYVIDAAVVSSNAQQVSGSNALVEVALDPAAPRLIAALNGSDVSAAFKRDPARPGYLLGLLEGLRLGQNTLSMASGTGYRTLSLTAYPVTGPIFSGPHQSPWICQTSSFRMPDGSTLGPALDADCSITPRVDYLYLPQGGSALVPVTDLSVVPANVAQTTTSAGLTVRFVVRLETRTVNRGIHQSAVLHDPWLEAAPTPLQPPRGWNRRLIVSNGVGCPGGWYIQGGAQGGNQSAGLDFLLLSPTRLGAGYATLANTLMHGANNCNPLLASEAAMMSKEQFIKTVGVPDITVSGGCSGGSYGALQPAERIPGLYDGVIIGCVFPDGLASSMAGSDARLLAHYFASDGSFSATQRTAVTGYMSDNAMVAATVNANRTDPIQGRFDAAVPSYAAAAWSSSVPVGLRYDPVGNPGGARPTVYDTARNMFGIDRTTGAALSPYDNNGVQYGLGALNSGAISVQQFLDLNANIGGFDADANFVARRSQADPGSVRRAYQSGLMLSGGAGLSNIPVFTITGIYGEDNNYHQQWQHFALRERMAAANGDTANLVQWRGNPVNGDLAWATFMSWVEAYKADRGSGSQRDKVVRTRPASAQDGCFNGTTFIQETPTLSSLPNTACNALLPSWTFPRRVAGGPVAANILQCALRTPQRSDYAVSFSDTQWQRLQQVFPQGVCDWSQPGQQRAALVANGSFGPSPLNLVFDITKP